MFSTEIAVTIDQVNYAGHVGVDAYLAIVHEARMRWLKLHGLSELNLGDNIGYVITKASMRYKVQSFYGDVLIVECSCGNLQKKTVDFYYRVIKRDSGIVAAIGETTHAFFNFKLGNIANPPKEFVDKFIVK
ncbi:MAG: putative thioesterase [Gammaproteobacteria bacterium]|jgi:acyl-CoA thioesterase FadM|nr:putative thioesterase [Gammaproteobacteria bacterium]